MSLGPSLQLQVAESWFPSQEWVPSTAEEKETLRQRRCWTYFRGGKCFLWLGGRGLSCLLTATWQTLDRSQGTRVLHGPDQILLKAPFPL